MPRSSNLFACTALAVAVFGCGGETEDGAAGQGDPEALAVTPRSVSFTAIENCPFSAGSAELDIVVTDPDARQLAVGPAPGSGAPWLAVHLSGAGPSWSARLTPAPSESAGLPAGFHRAVLRFAVAREDGTVLGTSDVTVGYAVERGFWVSPLRVRFDGVVGGTAVARSVYVGGSPALSWTATPSAPWIRAPSSGETGKDVEIAVDPTGLPAGTHEGSVAISALHQTNVVSVTLSVSAP
jgi:hypothetical protein